MHLLKKMLISVLISLMLFTPLHAMGLDNQLEILTKKLTDEVLQNQASVIAVLEFSNIDGNTTAFEKYVAEELTIQFVRTKKFQVVERELLDKVIKEHKLNLSGLIDAGSAKEIGALLGANAIVCGTITEFDKNVKINARLVATATGNIITGASVEVDKDADVLMLLHKVLAESKSANNEIPSTVIEKPVQSPVVMEKQTQSPAVSIKPTNSIQIPREGPFIKSYHGDTDAEAFVQPIINAIANKKPNYWDDFSSPKLDWKKDWGEGQARYENGELYITAKPKPGCAVKSSILPELSDFVLEVDQRYVDSSIIHIGFSHRAPGQKIAFCTSVRNFWVQRAKDGKENIIFFAKDVPFFKPEIETNHITIIMKGPQIAAFINNELVAMFKDPVYSKLFTKGTIYFALHHNEKQAITVRLDNLKIWDISRLRL